MGARFRGVSLPASLAYTHGDLGADVPVTATVATTALTTTSLAVGIWLLHFEVEVVNAGAIAGIFTVAMGIGSATPVFIGAPVSEGQLPALLGGLVSVAMDRLVQITAAGTMTCIVQSQVGATVKSTSTYQGGVPTNYTGVKLA